MIPVVFIHQGFQSYLPHALVQAARRNQVVLLGDEENKIVRHNHTMIDTSVGRDFDEAYVHMSTNPKEFERFCFHRWFILADWMRKTGIEKAFYCDSDVMLYCDVTEWAESVGNPELSYQTPQHQPDYRWAASAHVSLWSVGAVSEFCKFILDTYRQEPARGILEEKWRYHRQNDLSGGVCDMTLLYLFSKLHPIGADYVNNAKVINGATFDHNINVAENYEPHEYDMRDGMKRIQRDAGGIPCGYRPYEQDWIRFNALHFQGGPAKELMEEYQV